MNGFYGLNPEQAVQNINQFWESISAVALDFNKAGMKLFDDLRDGWFSPQASEFSGRFSPELYKNTFALVTTKGAQIANAAVAAYNAMAEANGLPPISNQYSEASDSGDFGYLSRADERGAVGILANLNEIVNQYSTDATNCLNALDNVPLEFSVFDPAGNIVASYQQNVANIKKVVNSTVEAMVNELQNKADETVGRVTTAAQKSADSFSSINPNQFKVGMK